MTDALPVGIHFGVPDEIYFAQDALGSSDRKALVLDPVEWQFQKLHGEDKETKAKIWGSALHARVLEGRKAFDDQFGVLPDPASIEGLLVTVADIKQWLDDEGVEYKKSAPKPQLLELVRTLDKSVPVWDEIKDHFEQKYPEDRRLTQEMADEIELASSWMQNSDKLGPIMRDGTFQFGAPEVTIIYEVDGVRLRARIDYLIPKILIDIKTYRPWKNTGEPVKGIVQSIGNFRYDLQAASYVEAFEAARQFWSEGKVFGEPPYRGFLDEVFMTDEQPKWLWIMVKGDGAPRPRIVEFPHNLTVFQTAQIQVRNALDDYRSNREKFGPDVDWQPDDDVIVLSDEDFPPWFGIN